MQDLRYAWRALVGRPLFAAVVVATLALAISANAAVFSIIDVLVLRDLPVKQPAGLVQFTWTYPGDPPLNLFSVEAYERYRDQNSVFSEMLGTGPVRVGAAAAGAAGDAPKAECVTGNFFNALGVGSAAGRVLEDADNRAGAAPVAVVSWSYWNRRLKGQAGGVGTTLVLLGDVPVTVVGIAERSFSGVTVGYAPDVWIPVRLCETKGPAALALLARLKDGVSVDAARAQMRVLDEWRTERFAARDPQWRRVRFDVLPANAGLVTPLHQQFARPLTTLMGVAALTLLLASVNIGGLFIAIAAARQREFAVRVSLGATRLRIARQLQAEALLLALGGALLGIAGAYSAAGALLRILTEGTKSVAPPPQVGATLDLRVLLFALVLAILAAAIFGLLPALAAFPAAPARLLRDRYDGGRARWPRLLPEGLVVAQIALALAVTAVAGSLIAHLSTLRNVSLGFDRTSVLVVALEGPPLNAPAVTQRYEELRTVFEAIPGVRSATFSAITPISGAAASRFVSVEGFTESPPERRRVALNVVGPGFFATLGTPVVAGREFEPGNSGVSRAVIVNEAMARHYFAGGNPLGKLVWIERDAQPYEIVGVVGDAKYADVRAAAPETIYLHHRQLGGAPVAFSLRTRVPPSAIAEEVRRLTAVRLAPMRVRKVTTLAEQVDAAIVPERLVASLSVFFGAAGLLLASFGVFALLADMASRRTHEIGARLALGATPRDIGGMVLTSALRLVAAGVLLGVPVAIWSTRVAAAMVAGLSVSGIRSIAMAIAVTTGLSLIAAWLPARRARRVDPVVALRSE